jgi:xanthine dehydrogenase large subunit
VLTAAQAHAARQYVVPPMRLARGDAAAALAAAPQQLQLQFSLGGQEQFYLEGQISYAVPTENAGLKLWCSTQHPTEMQHLVAHALGRPAHAVQVECRRMGGGFGGKESQSSLFACVAAVAAARLGVPVKLRVDRDDDFLVTGRRHPFDFALQLGHDAQGMAQHLLPMIGGSHAAPMTVKQAHAQFRLQQTDLTAQGGLRDVQPVCGLGQAAQFGDMNQGAKL